MKAVSTVKALREELAACQGKKIGFVPTMGALHSGHASLIDASVSKTDVTVVSVFVNPIQFGKNEDLDKYPRCLDKDAELAEAHGASFIFAPSAQEMYPAWTMAADVSLYYRQPIALPMGESYFSLGFNLSNLGDKMTYDGDVRNFIPERSFP